MYWYCGEHFDFLVSFLQEWVFFPYGHPTESWYIEIAEHIVCVHYRIIFKMRTRAQWMLESRKRHTVYSGMLSILGIGKVSWLFTSRTVFISGWSFFFSLYFVVHILFILLLYLLYYMYSAGSEMMQMEHLHKFTKANLTIMNNYKNYLTLLWFLQENVINYHTFFGRHFGK